MALEKDFYSLKRAESQTASLYDFCAAIMHLRDPAVAETFTQLAREERVHETQVAYLHNVYKSAPETFLPAGDATLLDDYLATLAKVHDYVQAHQYHITPGALLQMAINLEEGLIERHRTYFLSVQDKGIQQLVQNLMRFDQSHIQHLRAQAARFPLTD